MVHDTAS